MKPFDHLTFAETTHDGEGALHYGSSRGGDGAAGAPAPTGGRAPADGRGDEGEGGRRHSSLQAQLNNFQSRKRLLAPKYLPKQSLSQSWITIVAEEISWESKPLACPVKPYLI